MFVLEIIRIMLSKILMRNLILLIRLDYVLLILYPWFIQINVFVFLFYPIPDYSFSYEHFNTPSSIGQPRKPISNGLHQEYSSSFWLWLYTGKNRNHWFILLQGGTCCFTLIYWNVGVFYLLEDGHGKILRQYHLC